MKKIGLITVGLVVFFLTIVTICAQAQDENKQDGNVNKGDLSVGLKFTPEQENKLAESKKARDEELLKLQNEMSEKQNKFQEELNSITITKAAIEPFANEIKSLQAQIIERRINDILQIKEILTPEQFAVFQNKNKILQQQRKKASQDNPPTPK
jgi:Spy/CpxP family protein refolding chaperone